MSPVLIDRVYGLDDMLNEIHAYNESVTGVLRATSEALRMRQDHIDQFLRTALMAHEHDPDSLTNKRRLIIAEAWAEFKKALEKGIEP